MPLFLLLYFVTCHCFKNYIMTKTKNKKTFVLDTNVILHDYRSIYNFEDNDIVIPITVLEELDKFKRGNDQINYHAREFVRELDGVKYYNDSKGTNPDAAIQGIRAMNRPTLLIGGGYDKQSEYDEWIQAFDGKVKKLVLIGATKEKIAAAAKKCGFFDIVFADSLEEAIQICYDNAKDGDAVLLSPACASWDMFKSYEQRGDIFKEIVRNLKE